MPGDPKVSDAEMHRFPDTWTYRSGDQQDAKLVFCHEIFILSILKCIYLLIQNSNISMFNMDMYLLNITITV